METIKQELIALFSKVWVVLLLILAGIMGQISLAMLQGRKMTRMQVLASIGTGLFVGIIAAAVCWYKGWERAGIVIIPIATSLSEKIMIYIFSMDIKEIRQFLIDFINIGKK